MFGGRGQPNFPQNRAEPLQFQRVFRLFRKGGQPRERIGLLLQFGLNICGGFRADAFNQQQHAMPTHAVERIGKNPQIGEHVLDVRRLDEFHPADFDKRNVAFIQFQFQIERMKTGAKQHRHVGQRNPFVLQFENALRHELRLLAFVQRRHEHRPHAADLPRKQAFLE